MSLAAVAGWDVAGLRAALGGLLVTLDRYAAWVPRLDTVGRALADADCWSGPAARQAADQLVGVSSVATAVGRGLGDSLERLTRAATTAGGAQADAAAALATAAAAGVPLAPDGTPEPSPAATPEEAVATAAAAARVAALAGDALTGAAAVAAGTADALAVLAPLVVLRAARPADLGALAPVVLPVDPLATPPAGAGPDDVARWWSLLGAAGQHALVAAHPELVGHLDGLPAWARDAANRLRLAQVLAPGRAEHLPPPVRATAAVVAGQVAALEAAGRPVQLQLYDPLADLVAVSVGDLDDADAVAVLVPGVFNTPLDDLPALTGDAQAVVGAATAAAPAASVAALVWLGYRTPADPFQAVSAAAARRGGPALDRALDGLSAARGSRPGRVTVVAHSYGTLVTGVAARAPGALAADAVVLLGSPGTGVPSAAALEAEEVDAAAGPVDPIGWTGWFGLPPADPRFGATRLPVDPLQGHTSYFDPGHPTLAAVGAVVAGVGPR